MAWFAVAGFPFQTSAQPCVTHHWKGIFRLSQKSESEFLFRALTGPQWRRQFQRIRSGASERDGESMTCYTSLERKFQMQSIHRATISVAATKQEQNRVGVNVLLTLLNTGRTAQLVPTANSHLRQEAGSGSPIGQASLGSDRRGWSDRFEVNNPPLTPTCNFAKGASHQLILICCVTSGSHRGRVTGGCRYRY